MRIKANFEFYDKGHRRGPILDGYRPSISFEGDARNSDCFFKLISSDRINPGETQDIYLTLSHYGYRIFSDYIQVGHRFRVFEGRNVVGGGVVIDIEK